VRINSSTKEGFHEQKIVKKFASPKISGATRKSDAKETKERKPPANHLSPFGGVNG
jgi:hypothetical protein